MAWDAAEKVLRPRGMVFPRLIIAVAVVIVVVFGVLYVLTIPTGTWPIVLLAQAAVVALGSIGVASTRSVYFRLFGGGVEDHVPFGLSRTVRPEEVDTILFVDLYAGSGDETFPHMFAVDARDRLILRMHGQLWTRASIQQVAARLGAPVVHAPVPMTLREFTAIEPQLLSWWERRPLWRRVPVPRALADR